MPGYQLYCFAESGNAYKVALMLELCGADWTPMQVDFFNGETRTPEYRAKVNALGEVPVLVDGATKLSQSGVILDYLAEKHRKFGGKSEEEKREILRWMLFDNHKFTSYVATLRFQVTLAKTGETPVTDFLRKRAQNAFSIVNTHLSEHDFMIGKRPTIADISMCGYLFYGEELGIDLKPYPRMMTWTDRIASLPNWKSPYDLMPRAPAAKAA